ncbi:MAG: serine/threonine-protein phosphatase [Chloroflexota bacterium]|nr:serine/threonine-protein phosphatase [Chloroflexota bacterium]MDE3192367.1 serine/threonine-protein phosphatase [Chloroflexota bacterium]
MIELDVGATSETGPRPINEDHVAWRLPEDPLLRERKGALFVLADGVGGHAAGEVASATAAATLLEEYFSPSNHARVEPALQRAMQAANMRVYEMAERDQHLARMQTTLDGLAVTDAGAYVAHVGDGRVYHWRDGSVRQLTSDHSEVSELVRLRLVKREKLRTHPRRSILTRTCGAQLILRPDFLRQPLRAGDRFLLCTDGLWAALEDEEIARILGRGPAPDTCAELVAAALRAGTEDNVSAQVVRIRAVAATPPQPRWRPSFLGRAG